MKIRLLGDTLDEGDVREALGQVRSGRGLRILKKGSRSLVVWVSRDAAVDVVVKQFDFSKAKSRLSYPFGVDKASRTIRHSRIIRHLGFYTPEIYAAVPERVGGRLGQVTLLMEAVPDCVAIRHLAESPDTVDGGQLLCRVVPFLRKIHEAGLFSTDLVKNIEVAGAGTDARIVLMDVENTRRFWGIQLRRRRRDFMRLMEYGGASDPEEITSLLRSYEQASATGCRRLPSDWLSVDEVLAELERRRLERAERTG